MLERSEYYAHRGKVVLRKPILNTTYERQKIDVAKLVNGSYLIRIVDEAGSEEIQKLIINH